MSFTLAVDPGKNTGIALFNSKGEVIINTTWSVEGLIDYLAENPDIDQLVVENWRLRTRQVQQTGSKMEASQVIGILRLWSKLRAVPLATQDPQVMRIAAMHFQVKIPAKSHIPDKTAALLHGLYFLETEGVLEPIRPAILAEA